MSTKTPAPLTSERDREVLRSFARRIDPSDAGAHNNLGVLYYNNGLYHEAVSAFMKALELDHAMQVAQRNLEIAYFNTGYYDTRVPELRERLRQRPDDRAARWELGRTFSLLGTVRFLDLNALSDGNFVVMDVRDAAGLIFPQRKENVSQINIRIESGADRPHHAVQHSARGHHVRPYPSMADALLREQRQCRVVIEIQPARLFA